MCGGVCFLCVKLSNSEVESETYKVMAVSPQLGLFI